MRVLLIDPSRHIGGGKLIKRKQLLFPSIALPLLAALTPPDISVRIVNDFFEDIDFDEKVDLVGITAFTSRVLRAYEIADQFRRRGVYVVMGGIHVSMEPQEALKYADSVIAGEAEELWPQFLSDFKRRVQKPLYRVQAFPSLANLPVPKFSLINLSRYLSCSRRGFFRFLPTPLLPVQTARGCPYACEFCSVTLFSGGQYRARPVKSVVDEIKTLKLRGCIFIDDNIFADSHRAKELFEALIPLKLIWVGQGSLHAAKDSELLRLARKSGCLAIFIGLESIYEKSIASLRKTVNKVGEYEEGIRRFYEHGISIMASMIFGMDGEDTQVFKKSYRFLEKNHITYTLWHPLVPLPGTPLYSRLKNQDRLKEEKWWLNARSVEDYLVLKFKTPLSEEGLFQQNFNRYYRAFYSSKSILKRMLFPPQERFLLKILLNKILARKIANESSLMEN